MKKKNYKIFIVILSTLFLYFSTANFVKASIDLKTELKGKLTIIGGLALYNVDLISNEDTLLATYIGKVISYVLSILGVIFLVLLVYGGFIWMLARGDSEEVKKSKDIIFNAAIGIVIVLTSYAITYYVVSNLISTTMKAI
ncbi:MAG: hypothetical protein ABIC82_06535 [bacterium]